MAITKISDIIVPELFSSYVINRTMELSELFKSGIAVRSEEFDALASEAARTHNMPFFEDLFGDAQGVYEDVEIESVKIGSNKDVSTTVLRQQKWGASNLSAALAGADPMKAIGDLVSNYWSREMQKELIAVLSGVFGTTTAGASGTPAAETRMADHILDLSTGKTEDAKKINASAFIDACQLLGDAQGQLTAVAMHSATKSHLKKQNLIETERDSNSVEFDTYQGRRVIVDDGCPVDTKNGIYTTFLFGNGAFAYGEGRPVGYILTETDRNPNMGAGIDYLINRKAFILHPRGIAYTGEKRAKVETPSREELATAENWKPVYEPKQLRIVAIKHKIG